MNPFSASVARVLQGTVVAQAIGMLALPLLTRLFPPEAFGYLQLFSITLSLGLVVVSMRYEVAILQASRDEDAMALVRLCFWITAAVTLLTALVCALLLAFFGPWRAGTNTVLWMLAPGLLSGGMLQTLGYLPLRLKDFDVGARAKVAQVGAYVALAIAIGASSPVASGLVAADLLARGLAAAVICWWCVKRGVEWRGHLHRRSIRQVAWSARAMPQFAVPGGLVNMTGSVLTPIMMFASFDAATLGQYALVERSLMFPVAMIVAAVSQVFSADLAEQVRHGTNHANQTFRRIVFKMAMIGALPAVAVALTSPWLFPKLFGADWTFAGYAARLMVPLMFASFVTGPVNMAIMLAGRQKVQMSWEFARLAAVMLAWGAVVVFKLDASSAIAMHVGTGVVMCALYLYLADRILIGDRTPPTNTTNDRET